MSLKSTKVVLLLVILSASQLETIFGQQNGELVVSTKTSKIVGQFNNVDQLNPTDQVKIQYVNVNGLPVLVQFTYVGPPKILPIATADSYPEGSSINLICTVSGGQRRGLELSWMKDGQELDSQKLRNSDLFDNVSIGTDEADISILRIKNATNINSGLYTCTARNPLGQDSTSVKIVINVELKWNKIPKDVEIGLNQELLVDCDAVGSPQPTIEWVKHATSSSSNGTQLMFTGKLLKIARAQHKDSGLYECIARNGVDEDLRKVIQVKVRGK